MADTLDNTLQKLSKDTSILQNAQDDDASTTKSADSQSSASSGEAELLNSLGQLNNDIPTSVEKNDTGAGAETDTDDDTGSSADSANGTDPGSDKRENAEPRPTSIPILRQQEKKAPPAAPQLVGGGPESVSDQSEQNDQNQSDAESDSGSAKEEEMSESEIRALKLDLLFKISRFKKSGFVPSREFTVNNTIVELKVEIGRLEVQENMGYGLKVSRWVLCNGVTLIETMNENIKTSPIKLKGWSAVVNQDLEQYDGPLLEIWQTHCSTMHIGPFTKLGLALGFSAFNVHLSNTMNEKRAQEESNKLEEKVEENPKTDDTAPAKMQGPSALRELLSV